MPSLERSSKAKINNFNIVVVIEQNIGWLEVTVGVSSRMQVVQPLQQLVEVVTTNSFIESTCDCNILK